MSETFGVPRWEVVHVWTRHIQNVILAVNCACCTRKNEGPFHPCRPGLKRGIAQSWQTQESHLSGTHYSTQDGGHRPVGDGPRLYSPLFMSNTTDVSRKIPLPRPSHDCRLGGATLMARLARRWPLRGTFCLDVLLHPGWYSTRRSPLCVH